MTDWHDSHKGRREDHKATCHCGRKATKHVTWLWGCGNVCGIHARSIQRKSVSARVEEVGDVC